MLARVVCCVSGHRGEVGIVLQLLDSGCKDCQLLWHHCENRGWNLRWDRRSSQQSADTHPGPKGDPPHSGALGPRKRVVCSRYPLIGQVRENKYLDEDDADVPITYHFLLSPQRCDRRRHSWKDSFVFNTINNQRFVPRFPEYLLLWSYLH